MRNLLLMLGLSTCFIAAQSQEKEPMKPVKGTFSTYLLLNEIGLSSISIAPPSNVLFTGSFINTLYPVFTLKYYVKPTLCIRGYVGYGNTKNSSQFSDSLLPSGNLSYYDEKGAVKTYNLSGLFLGEQALRNSEGSSFMQSFDIGAGIERHFSNSRRFDPYFAGDIIYYRSSLPVTGNSLSYTSASHKVEYTSDLRGQINQAQSSVNLRATAGLNYFICKYFSVGTEFGLGYFYMKNKNVFSGHNKLTVDSKVITDNDIAGREYNNSGHSVQLVMDTPNNAFNNNFAIRLNFYFNRQFVD
jgi:hypothetical protein